MDDIAQPPGDRIVFIAILVKVDLQFSAALPRIIIAPHPSDYFIHLGVIGSIEILMRRAPVIAG